MAWYDNDDDSSLLGMGKVADAALSGNPGLYAALDRPKQDAHDHSQAYKVLGHGADVSALSKLLTGRR